MLVKKSILSETPTMYTWLLLILIYCSLKPKLKTMDWRRSEKLEYSGAPYELSPLYPAI